MLLGPLSSSGGMHLAQPNTATGYAYEQANFAMDFAVGPGGIAGGPVTGLRPFLVTGHVTAGGYAQFGTEVNYWSIPASFSSTGVVTITGPATSLGSLQYQLSGQYFSGAVWRDRPANIRAAVRHSWRPDSGDHGKRLRGRRSL